MRAFPRAVAVACFVLATTAGSAHASDSPAGGPALRQARAAWEKGHLDVSEPLYREALEKGGLSPTDVVEGYVRLGSIRASLGKRDQAIAAFRAASIIDSTFAVPSEAGPKGPAYAAQAKKDTARIGSIQLTLKAPKEATSGKPFVVTASLDSAHIPIVVKLSLLARDGTSGKEATAEVKPSESAELEVPAEVTMPSASILIRVDALDSHGNRLASTEERVRVPEGGIASAGGGASKAKEGSSSASSSASPGADTGARKGGGFWSSPWPYLIGGVALAGAGTAVYFGTRPSEQVAVGAPSVRAR